MIFAFRLFTLEASPDHFLMVSSNAAEATSFPSSRLNLRATDVQPGQVMWVPTGAGLQTAVVQDVNRVWLQGLYNPYTVAGTIVVNGVAATVHSRWFLDSVFDKMGLTAHLPEAYQVTQCLHLVSSSLETTDCSCTCLAGPSEPA